MEDLKNLETNLFLNIQAESFKMSNPDSVGVNVNPHFDYDEETVDHRQYQRSERHRRGWVNESSQVKISDEKFRNH